MDAKEHWNAIHAATPPDAVSWCQHHAELSLRMIGDTRVGRSASIIDVGGGASTLVDDLVANGYDNVTVLDLSDSALDAARKRLGEARAQCVRWIEGDITKTVLPADAFDVWHDRAVFHFLTTSGDRAAYVRAVLRLVKVGGHVIVATFAEDGPDRCSGFLSCAMVRTRFMRNSATRSRCSRTSAKLITRRTVWFSSSSTVIAGKPRPSASNPRRRPHDGATRDVAGSRDGARACGEHAGRRRSDRAERVRRAA